MWRSGGHREFLVNNGDETSIRTLGLGWLSLCAALAVHVVDEALSGFLTVYNPTVLAARAQWAWFPMPTFTFGVWLGGLILLAILLFALSPLLFRNVRALRPVAYALAIIMILNAVAHTVGTIRGRTFDTISFARPMPGFYSSPLLLLASIYLLLQLHRTKRRA